ncbi:MAG: hypothetical protein ACRD16_11075 [Thermoanaerobaculia bacterium]
MKVAAPEPFLQASLFPGLEEEVVIYQAQRLAEKIVRRFVVSRFPGAFYLKEVLPRGGVCESVGRDDHDLRRALLTRCAPGRDNILFGWTVASTPLESYRHECCLWHIKGGAFGRLETREHPAPPAGDEWAPCPECGEGSGSPGSRAADALESGNVGPRSSS